LLGGGGAESLPAVPQGGDPAATSVAHEAVTRALLDGRDARSAVAEVVVQQARGSKASTSLPVAPTSAMGAYASSVERVHGTLLELQRAWSPTATAAARTRLARSL